MKSPMLKLLRLTLLPFCKQPLNEKVKGTQKLKEGLALICLEAMKVVSAISGFSFAVGACEPTVQERNFEV